MQEQTAQPVKRTRKLGPRRAQAKQITQEKMVTAARKLFAKQGYDASTLRQIAATAGIGLATVFSHVRDKRELIYLIFNEELDEIAEKALASARPWQSFPEKILAMTEPVLRLFAGEPTLARILLTESFLESPGPHYARYLDRRRKALEGISEAVKVAIAEGEIQPVESVEMIAKGIYFAFSGITRWWISLPHPDWRYGQEQCERVLHIMVEGLRSRQKPVTSGGRAKSQRKSARRRSTTND